MLKKEKDFKIGIIDDHPQTAVSISQLLGHHGFKTFQAYNAKDAIEKCKAEDPDLILLDLKLGSKLSGYDVARELNNKKILFMTGFDVEKTKISKFKNVMGVLKKPVDIHNLIKKIRELCKIPEPKEI